MVLIFIDGLDVGLEGAIWIQIKKEGCLKNGVLYFTLDLLDSVFK